MDGPEKMHKNGVTTNGTDNNKNGSASKDKNVDEGLVALRRQPSIRDRRKVGRMTHEDGLISRTGVGVTTRMIA